MKPIRLKGHHKTREKLLRLKKEAEQAGAYRVGKRIHGIILNMNGKTTGEISDILGIARSNVRVWLTNYDEYGIDGLLEGQRSGWPAADVFLAERMFVWDHRQRPHRLRFHYGCLDIPYDRQGDRRGILHLLPSGACAQASLRTWIFRAEAAQEARARR